MTQLSEVLATGRTPGGTPLLSADELEASLGGIRKEGMFVQSMEAYTLKGEKEILTLEFGILGLDGQDDWEAHGDVERAFALVSEKISEARKSGDTVAFKVWLDNFPAL